ITDDRATIEGSLSAGGKICATCRGVFVAVKEGHPAYHRWEQLCFFFSLRVCRDRPAILRIGFYLSSSEPVLESVSLRWTLPAVNVLITDRKNVSRFVARLNFSLPQRS